MSTETPAIEALGEALSKRDTDSQLRRLETPAGFPVYVDPDTVTGIRPSVADSVGDSFIERLMRNDILVSGTPDEVHEMLFGKVPLP